VAIKTGSDNQIKVVTTYPIAFTGLDERTSTVSPASVRGESTFTHAPDRCGSSMGDVGDAKRKPRLCNRPRFLSCSGCVKPISATICSDHVLQPLHMLSCGRHGVWHVTADST